MPSTLVPELSVIDWQASQHFYVDILGFEVAHERREEGFLYLRLGEAELMIDQIGIGRDFHPGLRAKDRPLGRGLNLQIEVADVDQLLERITAAGLPLTLPPEDKTYRINGDHVMQRQFIVADPDGYLLRFFSLIP